jgi:phosphohistidine phosphatase SixA
VHLAQSDALELFVSDHKSPNAARHGFWPLLILPMLIAAALVRGESLSGKDLVSALQAGGYVILMRHASSPGIAPDAAHADADNARHERQLDAQGRASARAMGEALQRLKIPIGQVMSSPTYRALETVKLAELGRAVTFPQLGEPEHGVHDDKSAAWLKAKTAEPPAPGKNTFIVTHYPNIAEAYPEESKGLTEGEALILHPDGRGGAQLVARIKLDEWAALAPTR